ncbi:MAG: helix-turn-helix domain-containing protein [Lysobacter sp.]
MQSNQYAQANGTGCGARLRQARETAGLTRDDVSARLKMPVRVIAALESEDGSSLDAPVFVRGQLRSYARLFSLDIEAELTEARVAVVTAPELVSHTHIPRLRRMAEQVARRAIYIAVTAVIAVPVWMATSPHLVNNGLALQSLEMPPATDSDAVNATSAKVGADVSRQTARTPLVASFTSLPRNAAAAAPALSLSFNADSWVQVFATDGRALEQGVLAAGQVRRYAAGEVGRIVLGNSSAVAVEQAGEPVDLAPFSRANVARFTLSSDGSPAPVSY